MDRLNTVQLQDADVMDHVCISPAAVQRWMKLLDAHTGREAGACELPDEFALVESDGRLLVAVEVDRVRVLEMRCCADEWCWSKESRQ